MDLSTPVKQLNRVGETVSSRLLKLGIETAEDLLFYFPFRYEDFSKVKEIKDLENNDVVTIKGKVEVINNKRARRWKKNVTEALVSDNTGSIRVVWFNQPFITKTLFVGDDIFLSGKIKVDILGPQFVSPTYEKVKKIDSTHTARLVPVYPLTSGITEKQMRFLISQVLKLSEKVEDWLPKSILEQFELLPLSDALRWIHFPKDKKDLDKSTERLKFNELFLLQMKADLSRKKRNSLKASKILFKEEEIQNFVKDLPFILTKPQKVSAWEILQDLKKEIPMNRMLSGDVGSGKTVVGAISMFNAMLNNHQTVLMAPTEILASQHYDSLNNLLREKANVVLLTQAQFKSSKIEIRATSKTKIKKEILDQIKTGKAEIIVGTHALLSDNVNFNNLALVIVDEQHRFGVSQRKKIKDKGKGSHFLSMTATPIPRSLALVIYGDLDVSIIDILPPNRKKVMTRLVDNINRKKAYDFIEKQVEIGRQVFVVCPLIEEVDVNIQGVVDERKTVMSEYKKLSEKVFPKLKVGYLHGKMKSKEKEEVMNKFKEGNVDILVATSVVEVGVDIPNASVMMVEGAERFGLAQLHQFRGRVGRSEHQSYCFLFTDSLFGRAKERLQFFEKENNGFKLAEKDLEIRGPGEVYGVMQSGLMNLRLAKLTDTRIIKKARDVANNVFDKLEDFPVLLNKIKEWENNVHLE